MPQIFPTEEDSKSWYKEQRRPFFAPPSWLFGPVWTFLYTIIFISFGYVFTSLAKGEIVFFAVLPFILNLIFNLAFSPIQFGLRSNLLAAFDIILVLSTLVWLLVAIFPIYPWVAYANIPYLLWVSFATILQLSVTAMNWKNK